MNEVKPCPSCNKLLLRILDRPNTAKVICRSCGMSTGCHVTREQAIQAWNTRKHLEEELSKRNLAEVNDVLEHESWETESFLKTMDEVELPINYIEEYTKWARNNLCCKCWKTGKGLVLPLDELDTSNPEAICQKCYDRMRSQAENEDERKRDHKEIS